MSAAPNQGSTVTLALVQGESANPTATFSQAMAARQVVVGSGPAALPPSTGGATACAFFSRTR